MNNLTQNLRNQADAELDAGNYARAVSLYNESVEQGVPDRSFLINAAVARRHEWLSQLQAINRTHPLDVERVIAEIGAMIDCGLMPQAMSRATESIVPKLSDRQRFLLRVCRLRVARKGGDYTYWVDDFLAVWNSTLKFAAKFHKRLLLEISKSCSDSAITPLLKLADASNVSHQVADLARRKADFLRRLADGVF